MAARASRCHIMGASLSIFKTNRTGDDSFTVPQKTRSFGKTINSPMFWREKIVPMEKGYSLHHIYLFKHRGYTNKKSFCIEAMKFTNHNKTKKYLVNMPRDNHMPANF